jgi:hypothetical protein
LGVVGDVILSQPAVWGFGTTNFRHVSASFGIRLDNESSANQ